MNLSPLPIQKFFGNDGAPLVGGKLFTYLSGTSTKTATYTDSGGLTQNTNPIVLDYRGECRLWIDPQQSYTFVLAPATDTDPPTMPIWTVNAITAAPAQQDNAATDTGSVNAIALSIPQISSPVAFTRIVFKVANTNTGPVTITINGGTAKNLRYQNTAAFAGGEILSGGIYEAVFDGTQWQLQGPSVAWWRSAAEIAASVTPTNYAYPVGDVRRYGAVLDGTTDDTTALTNWAAVGGDLVFPVPSTAKITAAIPLVSNTTINFVKGALIQTATTNISFFTASSKANITIRGGHFKQTAAGASGYTAAVKLTSCTDCLVENCDFEGMQWSGVFLNKSVRCTVRGNYFHGWLGTVNDSNGVCIYEDATDNIVEGNTLSAAGWHAILLQDPYTSLYPNRNLITGNRIGAHSAYGIAVYIPGTTDTYNQIIGNYIEGITGSADTTLFGSGIYVVGYGAGGTLISGNTVRNCCTATTATTNGPAGISVAGLYSSGAPVVVSNNIVEGMTKYWGILAVTNLGIPVTIIGNSVTHPTGNTTGEPIRAEASNATSVIGNNIACSTASGRRCIALYANSVTMVDTVVSNNICVGGGDRQIEFLINSGAFTRAVITGNICRGAASAVIPMYLASIDQAAVSNNVLSATSAIPLYISACTKARISNNVLETTGTVAFGTTGTCTGSYSDKTNGYDGLIENAGTGLLCESFGTAAPSSGSSYAIIGDRVENSNAVIGDPKAWRCTTAGNPGTWTSEGNL